MKEKVIKSLKELGLEVAILLGKKLTALALTAQAENLKEQTPIVKYNADETK